MPALVIITKRQFSTLSLVSHIPWASRVLQRLPSVGRDIRQLRKFGIECATNRMRAGSMTKDLWYHLVGRFTPSFRKISYTFIIDRRGWARKSETSGRQCRCGRNSLYYRWSGYNCDSTQRSLLLSAIQSKML